jgi:hypothetical protein
MATQGWLSFVTKIRKTFGRPRPQRGKPDHRVRLQCEFLEERVVLDDNSAGPNGINARVLNLTGTGIYIGQVEPDRPGLKGANFDSKPY